ncbi:glucose-dependent insulinotropic receptor [Trichoderma cornu-damae]|uniref:Glucose-dependent insulinotropic receptor n=1 Tax=Trichoderma cornu-damae TaxID=654480 RepID=A0A9P8QMD3_9HYPO|nr:glucose-dependent insulinotropic receptor [Trichoderma cornu-damae]
MRSHNVLMLLLFAVTRAAPVAKEGLEGQPLAPRAQVDSDIATSYRYEKRDESDSDIATSYRYEKRDESDSDAATSYSYIKRDESDSDAATSYSYIKRGEVDSDSTAMTLEKLEESMDLFR